MIDRIEKVARVKGVDHDMGRSFDRKEGYEDRGSGKKFSDLFQQESMRQTEKKSAIPAAYRLEIGRATQSLFYEQGLDFRGLWGRYRAYR